MIFLMLPLSYLASLGGQSSALKMATKPIRCTAWYGPKFKETGFMRSGFSFPKRSLHEMQLKYVTEVQLVLQLRLQIGLNNTLNTKHMALSWSAEPLSYWSLFMGIYKVERCLDSKALYTWTNKVPFFCTNPDRFTSYGSIFLWCPEAIRLVPDGTSQAPKPM